MIKIRQHQLSALNSPKLYQANLEMANYVRLRFPSVFQKSSHEETSSLITEARTRARRYNIVREDNIATFLDLTVMYGNGFDKEKWAADILNSPALHGPDKMAILRHRVRVSGTKL